MPVSIVRIGNGDISLPGAAQGSEMPNPAPASPLFSAILRLDFVTADAPSLGHALPASAHATLARGDAVYLRNGGGESVRVSRLVDFPDYVAEPRSDEPRHVRVSNPFGMVGNNWRLTMVDASMNLVWDVTIRPTLGEPRVLARLAPVANTVPGLGPPMVEAVPAAHRAGARHARRRPVRHRVPAEPDGARRGRSIGTGDESNRTAWGSRRPGS